MALTTSYLHTKILRCAFECATLPTPGVNVAKVWRSRFSKKKKKEIRKQMYKNKSVSKCLLIKKNIHANTFSFIFLLSHNNCEYKLKQRSKTILRLRLCQDCRGKVTSAYVHIFHCDVVKRTRLYSVQPKTP